VVVPTLVLGCLVSEPLLKSNRSRCTLRERERERERETEAVTLVTTGQEMSKFTIGACFGSRRRASCLEPSLFQPSCENRSRRVPTRYKQAYHPPQPTFRLHQIVLDALVHIVADVRNGKLAGTALAEANEERAFIKRGQRAVATVLHLMREWWVRDGGGMWLQRWWSRRSVSTKQVQKAHTKEFSKKGHPEADYKPASK
jgi:hypothetical protein